MTRTVMLLSTVPDERPEAALKTAADLGYRTIMCAEGPDAQLEAAADAYYIADWSDTEELLRIARKEHIDGAVGLCDPAMIPAAEITREGGYHILMVAAFRPQKDHATLIRAVHLLPGEYRLLLAGETPLEEQIRYSATLARIVI